MEGENATVREQLERKPGYIYTDSAGPPTRTSERDPAAVEVMVMRLEELSGTLRKQAGMLDERLQPVLMPAVPEDTPMAGAPRTGVPLGDRLADVVESFELVASHLAGIHRRVEV